MSSSISLCSSSHALSVSDSSKSFGLKESKTTITLLLKKLEPGVVAQAPKEKSQFSCPFLPLWETARPPLD